MGSHPPPLLAAVSLLSALHMVYLATRVGRSRRTHKVLPPAVTGPPEFERTFRAHQNCVEVYPLFLFSLWTSGLFFHEETAAAAGLVYIVARQVYVSGYIQSTKKRLPGFYLTLGVFAVLVVSGSAGILCEILDKYFHIHT